VPNTGAWNAYQLVQKTGVSLSSGIQTVRVEMVTAGSSGFVGAFDWFRAVTPVAQSAYSSGTPWAMPGTVEMENFDIGGEGVAYHDASTSNEGGKYRATGVDIAQDANAGNGYVVGWTPAGEWLEYTVNITTTGTYTLETRVAGVGTGGQFRIRVNGTDQTGLLSVPNTGAWNAYQLVQKTGVSLSSGIQTVRVEMVTAGSSRQTGAFDLFRIYSGAAGKLAGVRTVQSVSPIPLDVRTSNEKSRPAAGWLAVDRDFETAWEGVPGGGWLVLVYDLPVVLDGIRIAWEDGSSTNVQCLHSLDAGTWETFDAEAVSVTARYLWLIFPDEGPDAFPAIQEIRLE
jgi:hypothetical protein